MSYVPHVGLQSLFLALQLPSLEDFMQFKYSYSTLIAQGLGGMINTWTNQETPGALLGYHYGSTSLYTSCLDQNKAVHFGDLIRLALPHIFTVALSHCLHFVSVKELGQTDRERFVFGGFFVRTFLVCSHWSAALGDSCCDCGAQLNLKLLI